MEVRQHYPDTFYFDEDIANNTDATRQLEVLDRPTTVWDLLRGDDVMDEEHWLKNKSEDFYNGMYASVNTVLWLLEHRKIKQEVKDAVEPYLLGLRFAILKIYHKKNFQ